MNDAPDEARNDALPTLSDAARRRVVVTAVVLVALLFGAWGCWRVFAPQPTDARAPIAERDEEVAALRADVDFYERFVGATAQRRGLSVHELHLERRAGEAWHFTATLTQNLNRGVINRGDLQLEIEGTRDGRLQTLDWQALRQDTEAPPVDYSFRYFQQVEGDFVLPGGFRPVSVTVRLGPSDGKDIVQEFDWQDATTSDAP